MAARQPRVNRRIRISPIRVIDSDGTQLGIIPTSEALALAEDKGLDLVEVAPKARPPVCKVMDYGKYMYEQNKRAKEAKKRQHVTHVKEVKMRPKIEQHDYEFKLRHAREFLADGDKVKVTIIFRGREMAHKELGVKVAERVVQDLEEEANVEVPLRHEGRSVTLVLSPKPRPKTKTKKEKTQAREEGAVENAEG